MNQHRRDVSLPTTYGPWYDSQTKGGSTISPPHFLYSIAIAGLLVGRAQQSMPTGVAADTIARVVVPPAGGDVSLRGIASTVFPEGWSHIAAEVWIVRTGDSTVRDVFDASAPLFESADPLPYGVRIATGFAAPRKAITVMVAVPEDYVRSLPLGHAPQLYVLVSEGGSDESNVAFERLPSVFDRKAGLLRSTLKPGFFVNDLSPQGHEAVILVGSRPPS